jgi:hypothetical protein
MRSHLKQFAPDRVAGLRKAFRPGLKTGCLETRDFVPKFESIMERSLMLWTIIIILLVLWLLGLLGHVGGSLIHLLLVIAVIVLVINLVRGRRPL